MGQWTKIIQMQSHYLQLNIRSKHRTAALFGFKQLIYIAEGIFFFKSSLLDKTGQLNAHSPLHIHFKCQNNSLPPQINVTYFHKSFTHLNMRQESKYALIFTNIQSRHLCFHSQMSSLVWQLLSKSRSQMWSQRVWYASTNVLDN
jgi:hypothetical protein